MTCPQAWNYGLASVSYTFNDGITFPSQATCCGSEYGSTFGSGTMVDAGTTISGTPGGSGNYGAPVGYINPGGGGSVQSYYGVCVQCGSINYTLQTCTPTVGCTCTTGSLAYSPGTPIVVSIGYNGTLVAATTNYANHISRTTNIPTFPLHPSMAQGSSGVSTLTTWFRVRAYPPNGVMPSVIFGHP